ncbi:MobB family relaxase [Tenacibaculum agarivorans]|uniref:MobB family relaxase n=1 Tax=Tenacibaculum agarivorans TaxID=1908389 RepID=UPI00094BA232|nr:MobB family relaxase [Tenacibaculum agarivorans]
MFVKIDRPYENIGGDNKGSSYNILTYLEKENEGKDDEDKSRFFNQNDDELYKNQAMDLLDNNHKNLGTNDAKFYSLSISPSAREQQHILAHIGVKREVNSLEELSQKERELFEKELQEYTKGVMNLYAANFNRGITANDLVYVAKVEHQRHYNHKDPNVMHNSAIDQLKFKIRNAGIVDKIALKKELKSLGDYKRHADGSIIKKGDQKPGFNSHIHVVVSRNNKDQNMKLSPLAKPRLNTKHKVPGNDKDCTIGFNQQVFKEVSAEYFNEKYDYKSQEKEQFDSSAKEYQRDPKKQEIHLKTKRALQQAKHHILQGTFKTEEKVIRRAFTPVKELKKELRKRELTLNIKQQLKGILTGKSLEK